MKATAKKPVYQGASRPVFWSLAGLLTVMLLAGVYLPGRSTCSEPVTYRIGAVDERFGLSLQEVAEAAGEAAAVWEEASGRDLFREDRHGEVEINLVYDYRQAAADRLKGIGGKLENTRSYHESLMLWFTTQEAEFRERQDILRQDIETYNGRITDLSTRYEAAARSGRISEDIYRNLEELKEDLDDERETLQARQEQLNGEAQSLNDLVTLINQIAKSLNLEVMNYNTTGKPLQDEFQEGCFEKGNGSQRITIYYFSDHNRLVRLLAHELGHALGLDHNDNPDAIMYRINQSESLVPAPEDLAALQSLCGGAY